MPTATSILPRRLAPLLVSLSILAIIFLTPLLCNPLLPLGQFDPQDRIRISQIKPRYIIIGNSLANAAIDTDYLAEWSGQKKVLMLYNAGSFPNLWYFRFKNDLIASGIPAGTVFFFFVENLLTAPITLPHNGYHEEMVRRKTLPDEPLQEVAARRASLVQYARYRLGNLYRLASLGSLAHWYLDNLALLLAMPEYRRAKLGESPPSDKSTFDLRSEFLQQVNRLFTEELQRHNLPPPEADHAVLPQQNQQEMPTFSAVVDNSFLPEILRLGQQHGYRMIFVRMKAFPAADGSTRHRPGLDRYNQDLENYLARHGAMLVDFSHDAAVTPDKYVDGYHIHSNQRHWFTEHFARRMTEVWPNDLP